MSSSAIAGGTVAEHGRLRQSARRIWRRLGFLRVVAAVAAPPEVARPARMPGAGTPAVESKAARHLSPRERLAALGAWMRRHGLLRHEAFVAYLASTLSIAAYAWYTQHGLTLAYGDAISHMEIARRVFISRTPGLGQLGSVWLPLNHLLMLPLIWWDVLYHDGFAGALPSMVAYVIGAVYTYRTSEILFKSRISAWAAALVLVLNPNVLYMQATAMSELDLICFAILTTYYLVRWVQAESTADLVKCALFTACGTLVRYDGWALAVIVLAVVVLVGYRRHGRSFAEANSLLFATLGLAGCVGWVLYDIVIFHNPLQFYSGDYSAAAQQQHIRSTLGLPTYHNPVLSLQIYAQAVIDNLGWPLAVAMVLGLVVWVLRSRLSIRGWPIYVALTPFIFNWLSLVAGVSIIQTPEFPFHGTPAYFNVRYGMMMIPAASLFVGALLTARRELAFFLLTLVCVVCIGGNLSSMPYVLHDPVHTSLAQWHAQRPAQAVWIAAHYAGGTVLVGGGPSTPILFYSYLPDTAFLTDADGAGFSAALANPERYAQWIVMDPDSGNFDPVWAALHNRTDWRQYYVLAVTFGTTQIYERITPGTGTVANGPGAPPSAASASSAARAAAENLGFDAGLAVSRALATHLTAQQNTAGGAA